MLCIGLFGTCGNSRWREPFMAKYQELGLNFFNPQVADWKQEDAEIEAKHLTEDAVILFPVTGETYGTGSLAEVGFSILQAIRLDDRRDFIIMIEKQLASKLVEENPVTAKESMRSRALVVQHLRKLNLPNVYLVDTLDDMLAISAVLYGAAEMREPLRKFNPQNR